MAISVARLRAVSNQTDFGLHNITSTFWQWTSASASRPDASQLVHVIKGGSYLCSANYCARYRPAARQFQ